MKRSVVRGSFLVLFMSLLIFVFPCITYAEDAGIAYTYRIEKPDNQLQDDVAYFDLMMTPSQEQVLEMTIMSLSDKDQTIQTVLDSAKTNSNGVIEYNQINIDKDESAAINFNDLVTTEKEFVLKAKETKTLQLSVKMPEVSFDGVVAGGLTLKAKEDENSSASSGARVKNEYAYVIAILLRENNNPVQPNIQYRKSYAGDRNYNNTIYTRVANAVPAYQKDVTLEAQISKSGSDEILYEARQTGIQMAPNSSIDFPISMDNDEMVPGKYRSKGKATIGSQTWEWDEEFEITKKEADKYNEKNSALTQETVDWKLILLLVSGFVLILGLVSGIYFFIKKKKEAKKAEQARKKKRKSKTER